MNNIDTEHPMLGRRCLIRTYSAGIHIGTVEKVTNGMEVYLKNCFRLWKFEGCLSLSSVAEKGITGGMLERTNEVYLTNAVEFIPTTPEAEATYSQFIVKEFEK